MAEAKSRRSVLLATHIEPVIHGQAMMANHLVRLAKGWDDISLYSLNTVYAEDRGNLGGASLGKITKLFSYMMAARKLIRKHQISHVILCVAFFKGSFLKDSMMILFFRKLCGVEVISWVHMDPNRLNGARENCLMKKLIDGVLRNVSCWVACAPGLLEKWPAWLGNQMNLHAVCNGIDEVKRRKREVQENDVVRVTYLSAMDDEKGWKELYSAAESILVADSSPRYEFHFYGGAGKQYTEEQLKEHFEKAPKGIYWHGSTYGEEKKEALQQASIFVLPSHTEQFPLAVLDAMSYGLPVIATDVGAISDALPEAHLVSAPADAQWLADEITKLGNDPEKMLMMGEENLKRFREEFTLEQFSKKWHQLLIAVLN